jgi:hypothetical protein
VFFYSKFYKLISVQQKIGCCQYFRKQRILGTPATLGWNASDASNSNIASSSRDKANAGMPAAHEFVDSRGE